MSRPSVSRPELSFGDKPGICFSLFSFLIGVGLLVSSAPGSAQETPERPRILGISVVTIAAPHERGSFYTRYLGLPLETEMCMGACELILDVNAHQHIYLLDQKPVDGPESTPANNYIRYVAYEAEDIRKLHQYLIARGLQPSEVYDFPGYGHQFWIANPEGQRIGFVQFDSKASHVTSGTRVSAHIIHTGFVVQDRAAMEHFYKDILGFRPYWHGGMKDGKDDWVALQVPDGTDWVEFMLNISPDADKHTLGVMNHIALGVPDIHAVQKQLLTNGMKLTEEPKIGRDGKWQLNVYDPDDTRVEFMEFTPVEKPCCSEFTGPHPKP